VRSQALAIVLFICVMLFVIGMLVGTCIFIFKFTEENDHDDRNAETDREQETHDIPMGSTAQLDSLTQENVYSS